METEIRTCDSFVPSKETIKEVELRYYIARLKTMGLGSLCPNMRDNNGIFVQNCLNLIVTAYSDFQAGDLFVPIR